MAIRKATKEIILHCAATLEGKDYTVEQIDRMHKQREFAMIGYHYVIYRDGSIHRGRPERYSGAHTTDHNSISIGVCYIGGVANDGKTPNDTRTPEQKRALIELVHWLCGRFPYAAIHGHREFANKACPSFDVQRWLVEEYEPRVAGVFKCNLK